MGKHLNRKERLAHFVHGRDAADWRGRVGASQCWTRSPRKYEDVGSRETRLEEEEHITSALKLLLDPHTPFPCTPSLLL